MPRSRSYYQHRPRIARVDDVLVQRIKHVIDDESYLGYRMVWATLRGKGLRVNRKAVQRIMQLKRWQCHRRLPLAIGVRRIIGVGPAVFEVPAYVDASNVSIALHDRVGRDDAYLVYGDANALATAPQLLLKWVHYFGAEKGS